MKIAKPKLVYSIVAVCAVVSASVLAAGVYSGFFADASSEVTAQPSVTAPTDGGGSTAESGVAETTK